MSDSYLEIEFELERQSALFKAKSPKSRNTGNELFRGLSQSF